MSNLFLARGLLFIVALLFCGAQTVFTAPRPNIVLLMADDQGWGETGYNGHPHVKTPVLDEMAARGLRFDRFYSGAPNCSPTRASVMTGRHANRSGAFSPNWSTRPEEITIAHILKQAGYRTAHFGKWHIGAVKKDSPVNPHRMGFDEYLSHDNFFELDPPLSRNGAAPEIHRGESSEIIVNEAVQFVRKVRREDKPFFVVIWFGSPHGPYSGLEKDIALYRDLPDQQLRLRLAEITAMDRAIGSLRQELRSLGVADNTLLWFKSDNGLPKDVKGFDAGWRGRKGELYEGGIRVPAIVEWPAVIKKPRITAMPCVTSDILPTLLDVLELKHPVPNRPLDGISLRRLLMGGEMEQRPSPIGFWKYPVAGEKKSERWISEDLARGTTPTASNPAIDFLNFKHPVARTNDFGGDAVWMDQRFKLVVIEQRRSSRTELYDLLADPRETTDVAADHPQVVQRMTAQLHEWQRSVERSLTGADYR